MLLAERIIFVYHVLKFRTWSRKILTDITKATRFTNYISDRNSMKSMIFLHVFFTLVNCFFFKCFCYKFHLKYFLTLEKKYQPFSNNYFSICGKVLCNVDWPTKRTD